MEIDVGSSPLLRRIFEAGMASYDRRAHLQDTIERFIGRNGLDGGAVLTLLPGSDADTLESLLHGLSDAISKEARQAYLDVWKP